MKKYIYKIYKEFTMSQTPQKRKIGYNYETPEKKRNKLSPPCIKIERLKAQLEKAEKDEDEVFKKFMIAKLESVTYGRELTNAQYKVEIKKKHLEKVIENSKLNQYYEKNRKLFDEEYKKWYSVQIPQINDEFSNIENLEIFLEGIMTNEPNIDKTPSELMKLIQKMLFVFGRRSKYEDIDEITEIVELFCMSGIPAPTCYLCDKDTTNDLSYNCPKCEFEQTLPSI